MKPTWGPWILIIIFLANFIFGFGLRLYTRAPLFDITLHFLGGLGVYLTLHQLLSKKFPQAPTLYWSLLVIGGTMLVGVLWEFTEYVGNVFFGAISGIELIGDLEDTLSDLFMDMLGASLGAFLHALVKRRISAD